MYADIKATSEPVRQSDKKSTEKHVDAPKLENKERPGSGDSSVRGDFLFLWQFCENACMVLLQLFKLYHANVYINMQVQPCQGLIGSKSTKSSKLLSCGSHQLMIEDILYILYIQRQCA